MGNRNRTTIEGRTENERERGSSRRQQKGLHGKGGLRIGREAVSMPLQQEVGAFQEGLQKVCSVVGRIEEGKAEAAQQAIPGGNADQPCTRGYIEEGMDCGFGRTCHMCNDESMFTEMKKLGSSEKVTLGDGRPLEVAGEGTIDMEMLLTDGNSRGCALQKVLYVPELAYNLVSVLKGYRGRENCQILQHLVRVR